MGGDLRRQTLNPLRHGLPAALRQQFGRAFQQQARQALPSPHRAQKFVGGAPIALGNGQVRGAAFQGVQLIQRRFLV